MRAKHPCPETEIVVESPFLISFQADSCPGGGSKTLLLWPRQVLGVCLGCDSCASRPASPLAVRDTRGAPDFPMPSRGDGCLMEWLPHTVPGQYPSTTQSPSTVTAWSRGAQVSSWVPRRGELAQPTQVAPSWSGERTGNEWWLTVSALPTLLLR